MSEGDSLLPILFRPSSSFCSFGRCRILRIFSSRVSLDGRNFTTLFFSHLHSQNDVVHFQTVLPCFSLGPTLMGKFYTFPGAAEKLDSINKAKTIFFSSSSLLLRPFPLFLAGGIGSNEGREGDLITLLLLFLRCFFAPPPRFCAVCPSKAPLII